MSNQNWDDDDFDFEEEDDQPVKANNSNDLVKQLRKAQRAAEKRAKEMEAELSALRVAQRENVIKSVLETKGVNPKIARFIPSDIESSETALNQWLEEHADVFGVSIPQQQADMQPDLAAMRQIDAVTAGAVTPDKIENLMLRMDQANSAEDIINMIYSANQ